jgi:NAD(P)H-hydrate epimerase
LKTARVPVVLTPHPGEMARLIHSDARSVQSHRLRCARDFAREHGAVLVLKGSGTIVAAPDGRVFLNPTGNPGMAKGGSGDVLAGMIASFAAQGIDPVLAAVCGVYLHGLAGDRCAKRLSQRAMLPSDLVRELPALFSESEQ